MKNPRKHCAYCGRWYQPDPRTVKIQKSCKRTACRRTKQRQNLRRWRVLHPDRAKRYQPKMRAWAKSYPNYWQHYRATHPEYSARDNRRRVEARKRAKRSANETTMLAVVAEKLQTQDSCIVSANETAIDRRVKTLEECLRLTVTALLSAKQTDMVLMLPGKG